MAWWGWLVIVYGSGFFFVLMFNSQLPVTGGLALLRSFVWPIWLLTGGAWPAGQPERMD